MKSSIVYLLFGGILIFAAALFGVAILMPDNDTIYATFANVLSGFVGAFLMYIRNLMTDEAPKPADAKP